GGNMTGVTSDFEELITKQLQLLKEAVPKLSRIALLHPSLAPATLLRAAESASPESRPRSTAAQSYRTSRLRERLQRGQGRACGRNSSAAIPVLRHATRTADRARGTVSSACVLRIRQLCPGRRTHVLWPKHRRHVRPLG